jgi:ATP-dependent Clp protease ATP-binding subunit ClpX
MKKKNSEIRYCSFCGKTEYDTKLMLYGIDSCICDECLALGHKVVQDNKEEINKKIVTDVRKPREIKAFLDQYIIGQDKAKEKLSVAIYNHYKRISNNVVDDIEITKSNVLLLGPSGTGKTLMAQTVAKMLDVPIAICDATVLTQAGYVGEDIESILSRLLQAADYDVEKAERGIVFIDEIDKIARKGDNPSITRDVAGEGVQQGLLKLLEGSIVNVPPQGGRKHPDQKFIQVNTKNILFICGGAFDGLEKRIALRLNQHTVGFKATNSRLNINKENEDKLFSRVTVQDLKKFGLIPEILGRLPVITYTESLNKEALIRILNEPKNAIIKQYQRLFEIDGIKLTFSKDVFEYIAEKAILNKTGARGLSAIVEDLMSDAMFNMPSENRKRFNVTLEYAKSKLENYNEVA